MKENNTTGCLARALYSNTPEAPNELLFRKGDILTIIEYDYEGQPGWWLCSHRGQRGICPSNYLELLDDKYAMPIYSNGSSILQRNLSHSEEGCSSSDSAFKGRRIPKEGEEQGKDNLRSGEFDPLETYDFPRSFSQEQQQKTTRSSSSKVERAASPVYANDEPLYENELPSTNPDSCGENSSDILTKTSVFDLYDVPRSQLPVYGQSLARLRKYGPDSSSNSSNNRASETSLASSASGRCSDEFAKKNNNTAESNNTTSQHYSNGSIIASGHRSASCDLGLPPTGTRNYRTLPKPLTSQNSINHSGDSLSTVTLRTSVQDNLFQQPDPYKQNKWRSQSNTTNASSSSTLPRSKHFNKSSSSTNRLSIQSESSADSGIGGMVYPPSGLTCSQMQDELYDVPRSVQAIPVVVPLDSSPLENNGSLSRPQSSLSVSSSGVGLTLENRESKDSLDSMYDVPRSVKSYVNHMETKYDQVVQSNSINNKLGKAGSTSGSQHQHQNQVGGGQRLHSRHNSASSVFSAYGYSRKLSSASSIGTGHELYDVPRSVPPPTLPRQSSIAGSAVSLSSGMSSASNGRNKHHNSSMMSQSQISLNSARSAGRSRRNSEAESVTGMDYDVPSAFAKKVSLCDSSETISCQDNFEDMNELRLGASCSSISSCSSRNLRSVSQCNNFEGASGGASAVEASCNGSSSEVKILPLGPKAAVSVCEKLRHEVVTSISSILDQVKPKWRSKENLTIIMADLRFSCIRLSLAIKDMADFASRSMSNVKKLGDEGLLTKLHRLLTPVMNGSQIIQRDVDELEAYFWSVDRLSVASSSGNHASKNVSGDALDQLILCARSLKHDVTEISNFLALNSSALFKEDEPVPIPIVTTLPKAEAKVEDTQEDYDYVSLLPMNGSTLKKRDEVPTPPPHLAQPPPPQLTSRDEQLLEFYAAQIASTAPGLSQSISTFISAIQLNEPPESFNVHLKYVILMAYKMLFAGDTVHRNLKYVPLRNEIEKKANDLHKSILALYEASKVATTEFPKIGPMQTIVDKVWCTTQAATQLKRVIFNASCATL